MESPLRTTCWPCLLTALVLLALPGPAAAADQKVMIRLPYSHQFQFAGLYAAQAKGFFRARGLDVDLVPNLSGHTTPITEVLAGRAEFGITQGPLLVAARQAGQPLVAMAAIMQHSPQVLVARADSDIRTPHDLIGKRVALDQSSLVSEVRLMLEREGLDFSKVQVVENRWNRNELLTGEADAMNIFVIDGPHLFESLGIRVNVIRPVDYGVDFYGDCLFTAEAVVQRRRPVVEAVRAAVLEGWAYALREPEEISDWIVANLPDRPEHVTRPFLAHEAREVARMINADLVEIGHMNAGRWQSIADALARQEGGGDPARLEGFILETRPPASAVLRWVWWSLGTAAVVTLLTLFANRRLKRIVAARTRELQASESHYRRLFERSPVPIVEFDYSEIAEWFEALRREGVTDFEQHLAAHPAVRVEALRRSPLTGANPAALHAVGAATFEEMRDRLADIVTPSTIEVRLNNMVRLWRGIDYAEGEFDYRQLATGETRRFSYFWRMARDAQGNLSFGRAQTALLDVTEKRKAEAALRESEERYRLLFEAMPNPMWIFELATGRFVAFNEATVRAYGYSREELSALTVYDLRPPEEAERLRRAIASDWEDLPHDSRIWRHRRKDGTILQVEVYSRTILLDGRRCAVVLPFDLTAKRQADAALRESEARYRMLFEHAVGGVYRTTVDGRMLAANPALARMLGFATVEEMLAGYGDRIATEFYVKPGRRAEFIAAIADGDGVSNFESEVRGNGGRTVWISENVRAVRNAAGALEYFDGFVSDITPRRQLEAEYQRASKLEAVGILAGGIAHDFNNILTVVLGNITLAEMDMPAGPATELLRDAKRATLRARDLTQQLLTFAKGGDPVRAAVELPDLLREWAGFALHGAKARADFDVAADLWPALADKGQLGQVIQNLVINSVQAMPEGGIVRLAAGNETIAAGQAGALPAGRYVKLTVSDDGVGIPPEHLAKIFDPYFTTKQQGSGLGLATVYSIVRKHEGHIEVASQLGVGTVFSIWLPASPAEAAPAEPAAHSAHPFQATVLFMDDEPTIRHMAQLFVQRMGGRCETAADGAEAVAKYRQAREEGRPFNAVIMDLTVPGGMGGREAMERLLKIDPQVRAIVSSGYSRDPVLANYQAHGFKSILLKPYGFEQLRRILQEILAT